MLSEHVIRNLKPGPKTRIIWDDQVKGLGVRITPAGVKSYVLNYRIAGRMHRPTMARVFGLSLRVARTQAAQELNAIRAGGPDPLERQRKAREAPTINDGLDRFFEGYVPDRITAGLMVQTTTIKYKNQADNYLRPALGKRLVAEITRLDIESMAKRLNKTPTLRNRVLAFTSRLFNLFEYWEWRAQNTNPVRGIERAREEARDRTLSPS